tara:strand:+ start:1461 stop:2420 length:960 start_codon:yes stop_codon:yes gene_type:complete
MALRIAIVGPGRVGIAFARRFVRAGVDVLGMVGRDRARTQSRIDALGEHGGKLKVLNWTDVHSAHVVVFAVSDDELPGAIAAAAAAGGRPCSLWLHTSGRYGLEVFASAQAQFATAQDPSAKPSGVRLGALHPLLPFSGPVETHSMRGALALVLGEPRSMRLLHRLCTLLELQPVVCVSGTGSKPSAPGSHHHRLLYHAACALAANGTTALFGVAGELLQRAGGIAPADCDRIVASLMQAAVRASQEHGAGPALSGPVRRGDADTVTAHLAALNAEAKSAVPAYVALMNGALSLARDQGLAPADCDRIASALSLLRPSS